MTINAKKIGWFGSPLFGVPPCSPPCSVFCELGIVRKLVALVILDELYLHTHDWSLVPWWTCYVQWLVFHCWVVQLQIGWLMLVGEDWQPHDLPVYSLACSRGDHRKSGHSEPPRSVRPFFYLNHPMVCGLSSWSSFKIDFFDEQNTYSNRQKVVCLLLYFTSCMVYAWSKGLRLIYDYRVRHYNSPRLNHGSCSATAYVWFMFCRFKSSCFPCWNTQQLINPIPVLLVRAPQQELDLLRA